MEFIQAAQQYEKLSQAEKKALADNITESLMFVEEEIQETVLGYFGRVDKSLEKILRERLNF